MPLWTSISCEKDNPKSRIERKVITDKERNDLLEVYPNISISQVIKIDEQTIGINGQETRQVNYVIIDNEIALQYPIIYLPDGSFRESPFASHKCDIKEYDPKYKTVIQEAEKAVRQRMKEKNITGIGSCYTFWEWKKEYLKKKGFKWKSPSELNPGILYD